MRSFIIKPGDLIPIGRAGENQATEIRFDVTGWAETFGSGSYALVMRRPGEDTVYPITVATDGDYVVWVVSNVDTGIVGNAQVQLRYTVDGALAKSVIYRGVIGESLDNIVDPPDPYEDLIGQMVDLTERAEAAAESASGSAGTATTAAEAAQTAKTAAETAAGQAQSAKEAAQSSATTATQAKTAAQTAQSSAEAAKAAAAQSATAASGSATAAAGSASQASASATAAAGSATAAAQSAAAAQAAAMNVIDKAPVIVDTASGAIASFPDGSAAPIKQLTVAVNPVQDLHGYENPWPAGGGKNILGGTALKDGIVAHIPNATVDTQNKTVAFAANAAVTETWISNGIQFKENTRYTIIITASKNATPSTLNLTVYYTDGTSTNLTGLSATNTKATSVTTTAANKTVSYIRKTNGGGTTTLYYEESGVFEGANQPFSPYENICPITGRTGAEVTRTGANILGGTVLKDAIVYAVPSATVDTTNKTVAFSATSQTAHKNNFALGVKFKPNTRYTIIVTASKGSIPSSLNIRVFYTDGTYTNLAGVSATSTKETVLTVTDAGKTVSSISKVNGGGTTTLYYDESGIFEGVLTAAGFAPYAGTSYPITWQSEAGTVYGGTLTVEQDGTGTLSVDRVKITRTWAEFTNKTQGTVYLEGRTVLPNINNDRRTEAICDKLKYSTASADYGHCFYVPSGGGYARAIIISAQDTDDFTFVYPLATPITYTLTAEEMTTLLGQNNWWSNTGDVSVTYRADTRIFIEKKLAALVAALS